MEALPCSNWSLLRSSYLQSLLIIRYELPLSQLVRCVPPVVLNTCLNGRLRTNHVHVWFQCSLEHCAQNTARDIMLICKWIMKWDYSCRVTVYEGAWEVWNHLLISHQIRGLWLYTHSHTHMRTYSTHTQVIFCIQLYGIEAYWEINWKLDSNNMTQTYKFAQIWIISCPGCNCH